MENINREIMETDRELRYGLMRFARLSGQIIFYLSLAVVIVGAVMFLLSLPDLLVWMFTFGKYTRGGTEQILLFKDFHFVPYCLMGSVVLAAGFFGIAVGAAIIKSYQYDTAMPSSYVRVCHKCGKPLQKEWLIFTCHECHTTFPLGVRTFIVRLFSQFVTAINWGITILMLLFFFR